MYNTILFLCRLKVVVKYMAVRPAVSQPEDVDPMRHRFGRGT